MKAKLLWLGLSVSVLVAFFSFALLPVPQPAAPSAVAPIPPSANTLRLVRVGVEPTPVPDTNGVPVPGETPYDDRPEAKAHYLQSYCNGYRLAAKATGLTFMASQCYFGPMPPP